MAWAGNAERICSGTLLLSPNAKYTDGLMNIGITASVGRFRFFRTFLKTFTGRHIHEPHVTYFEAKQLAIDTEPECDLVLDGELFGKTPAVVIVRQKELKVFTNQSE